MTTIESPETAADEMWNLRLYVTNKTPRSVNAMANLKRICEEHLAGHYRIEVVDLLKQPRTGHQRPDRRHPHCGAEAPGRHPQGHRRPVQYRDESSQGWISIEPDLHQDYQRRNRYARRQDDAGRRFHQRRHGRFGRGLRAGSSRVSPQVKYVLTLYVAGMRPRSQRAIDNIRRLCEEHLAGRYELQIIDIYQQPALAKARRSSPPRRW